MLSVTHFSLSAPSALHKLVHPGSSVPARWHASSVAAYLCAAIELCRQISHHHFLFRRHGDENWVFRPLSEARKPSCCCCCCCYDGKFGRVSVLCQQRGTALSFLTIPPQTMAEKRDAKLLTTANLSSNLLSEDMWIPCNGVQGHHAVHFQATLGWQVPQR